MKIEHVAIWTTQLEALKDFYATYFSARAAAPKYVNPKRQFESYFLTFPDGGACLEIMRVPDLADLHQGDGTPFVGYAHIAISVGSKQAVDDITAALRQAGVPVLDGPRTTGDGYYETLVLDLDGNRVEITV
jgi:lactoylglutathione lyase